MEEERKVVILNIDDILPNRFQPRIKFNESAINELAESIKLHGVIQPIVVRKISDKYEIIAGERRYKASVMAGKTTIPAIVTTLDDRNSAEVALIENVQRQDLTPIEEAISYKKILDMGYINQEELGSKLGKKQSTIANKLRLLNLNDEVQEALMENKISERHARSLLKLDDKRQTLMLNRIINERLTVRKTDEEIAKLLENEDNDNGTQKQIKEEKGEQNMNNDILKDFNIPTEPIVNDTEKDMMNFASVQSNMNESIPSFEPEVNIINNNDQPSQPNPTPQPINPGFMDVDKIQSTAQDIVKEPEPAADMDQLLKPDSNISQPIESVEQPVPSQLETPQGGKFFNMFDFNAPEKDSTFIENVEEEQVNMDFGEPKYMNDTFNPINTNPTPSMEQMSPVGEAVSTPIELEIDPNETPVFQSVENVNEENIEPFNNPIQPLSLTDDDDFSHVEQKNDISQSQINSNNFMDQPINKSYMMDDEIKFDEEGEIEVQLPNQNENQVTVDMKTVINTIRECASTIERYGYKIETDEIDLDNSYEVTFKIQKND